MKLGLLVHSQMQGRLRVRSHAAVLSLACENRDVELALEYLRKWETAQPLPETLVQAVVAVSRETARPEVVEQVLRVLRETRQTLGPGSAAELRLWAER